MTQTQNYVKSIVEMEEDMSCSVMMTIQSMEMDVLKIVELNWDTVVLEVHQIPLITVLSINQHKSL